MKDNIVFYKFLWKSMCLGLYVQKKYLLFVIYRVYIFSNISPGIIYFAIMYVDVFKNKMKKSLTSYLPGLDQTTFQ